MISIMPVTREKICGDPKALLAILGDSVTIHTILKMKLRTMIT
jgi:hypothetical protein